VRHIVRLIQVNIERRGYTVIVAFTDGETTQKAADQNPDLIILNVTLPGPEGFATLQNLRLSSITSETPIVLITQLGHDEDIEEGLRLGATVCVKSPFEVHKLCDSVEQIISLSTT